MPVRDSQHLIRVRFNPPIPTFLIYLLVNSVNIIISLDQLWLVRKYSPRVVFNRKGLVRRLIATNWNKITANELFGKDQGKPTFEVKNFLFVNEL